jgi:hypothetical protein
VLQALRGRDWGLFWIPYPLPPQGARSQSTAFAEKCGRPQGAIQAPPRTSYESRREPLDQLVSQITPLPDQVGAAFIVRGRLVGAELFDSPRTFAQLLPKLVRSYGLDALDHSLPRDSAATAVDGEFQAFLEQLLEAATLRRPAVGLGEDLRIEAKEMVAAALVHEGKVVHLSAFVKER